MQRRIDLMDKSYTVTALDRRGTQMIQVNDALPETASVKKIKDFLHTVDLGSREACVHLAVKGETAFIKAFGRTFSLRVVDPVEQAHGAAGKGDESAAAPMPGTVVTVHVAMGEAVTRGQELVTIESMKILTVITAPRDGLVDRINFEPGMTFDKNDILVSLENREDT